MSVTGWLIGAVLALLVAAAIVWACVTMAKSKGRSPVVWGISGLIFGLLALLILAFMPSMRGEPA